MEKLKKISINDYIKNVNVLDLYAKEHLKEEIKFRDSIERKNKKLVVKDYLKRHYKTEYGIIQITKIRYKQILKNNRFKYVYFDNKFDTVSKFKSICSNFKNKIFELVASGSDYRSIVKMFPKNTISIGTISGIINKKNDQNSKINNIESIDNGDYIYIEIDDSYSSIKWKNHKKVKTTNRLIVMHLGLDSNKKMIKKTIVLEQKITGKSMLKTSEILTKIRRIIANVYGDKKRKIVVYGDGANFIKVIAKELKAKYILDRFHVLKAIKNLVGFKSNRGLNFQLFNWYKSKNGTNLWLKIYDLICKNKYKQAIKLLKNIFNYIQEKLGLWMPDSKKWEYFRFLDYIQNNTFGLVNYDKDFDIGSHTETLIRQITKSKFTKKSSVFGIYSFRNLLSFRLNSNENLVFL
ncbi:Mbov_0401 family ICE element transposase-like protein [Mesomycoplasma molare]|uniref:Transposase n=1 Tax=Mesomycoplasma molare TaxID=171288 RepID=A0ABY5TY76_9BACT|nr:hypothetical protein [Mesomycoplasma molare]UWD34476.1 hypothetical protein NX772_01440 [Mesomycoplasma molare]